MKITVRGGELEGRSFEITEPCIRVGRNPDCSVMLPDPTVSGTHAELTLEGKGWILRDLNSRNGTLYNEEPLTPDVPIRLGEKGMLCFGEVWVEFDCVQVESLWPLEPPSEPPDWQGTPKTIVDNTSESVGNPKATQLSSAAVKKLEKANKGLRKEKESLARELEACRAREAEFTNKIKELESTIAALKLEAAKSSTGRSRQEEKHSKSRSLQQKALFGKFETAISELSNTARGLSKKAPENKALNRLNKLARDCGVRLRDLSSFLEI